MLAHGAFLRWPPSWAAGLGEANQPEECAISLFYIDRATTSRALEGQISHQPLPAKDERLDVLLQIGGVQRTARAHLSHRHGGIHTQLPLPAAAREFGARLGSVHHPGLRRRNLLHQGART